MKIMDVVDVIILAGSYSMLIHHFSVLSHCNVLKIYFVLIAITKVCYIYKPAFTKYKPWILNYLSWYRILMDNSIALLLATLSMEWHTSISTVTMVTEAGRQGILQDH